MALVPKHFVVSRSLEWVMREDTFVCTDYNNILVCALRPVGTVLLRYVARRQVEVQTYLETY